MYTESNPLTFADPFPQDAEKLTGDKKEDDVHASDTQANEKVNATEIVVKYVPATEDNEQNRGVQDKLIYILEIGLALVIVLFVVVLLVQILYYQGHRKKRRQQRKDDGDNKYQPR